MKGNPLGLALWLEQLLLSELIALEEVIASIGHFKAKCIYLFPCRLGHAKQHDEGKTGYFFYPPNIIFLHVKGLHPRE